MNKFLLIIAMIFTQSVSDIYSVPIQSQGQRSIGGAKDNSKKGSEKEEVVDPRFTLTKPIPQGLNQTEQELTNFFSQEIMPIAQSLQSIVVGKEADTAREAATRRRQQKMAQAKRSGSRLQGRSGSRRATVSGRGGGRWGGGSSWGRGWGGFRPSPSRFSGSSYRPSSYRPTSSLASRSFGSSSTSSNPGSFFRSSSGGGSKSSSKGSSSKQSGPTKESDTSPSTTRSGNEIDKKAKKAREKLFAAKERTMSIINDINVNADATTTKDVFYPKILEQSDELVREFVKMQKLSDHEDLSGTAKSQFEKEFKKECEPNGKIKKFVPHCIKLISYPTLSNAVLSGKQTALRQTVFDKIAQQMSPSELKKNITEIDIEDEKYYRNSILTELAKATAAKASTPATPLAAADKTKLDEVVQKLKNIISNFETQLFDPTSKVPRTPLVDPTKIKTLLKEIEDAL